MISFPLQTPASLALLVPLLAAAISVAATAGGPEVVPVPAAISGPIGTPPLSAMVPADRTDRGGVRGLAQADLGNPLIDAVPALRDAPAPKWVKPGTQITYRWLSGTTARDVDWDADPPVGGSEGISQVVVAAAGRKTVAVDLQVFLNIGSGKPLRLIMGVGSAEPAGSAAGYWADPAILAQLPARLGPNTVTARMPYTAAGRTFDAIRIQSVRATGREAMVFDLASGVLLHANHIVPTDRGTSNTFVTFVGRRTLDLPWTGSDAPEWVADVREMKYAGAQVITVPAGPPITLPVTVTNRVTARGKDWMTYEQVVTAIPGPGLPEQTTTAPRACGPGQIGGPWLPPDGLAGLRRGQTIDDDPLTGMRTTVARVGKDERDRAVAEIVQESLGQRLTFRYDCETGVLVRFSRYDPQPLPSETTLNLRSVK